MINYTQVLPCTKFSETKTNNKLNKQLRHKVNLITLLLNIHTYPYTYVLKHSNL